MLEQEVRQRAGRLQRRGSDSAGVAAASPVPGRLKPPSPAPPAASSWQRQTPSPQTQASSVLPLARSHELRTPLNAITASAALLNDPSTGPLTAAQSDLLQMLDAGASNVVTIVDDILNLHSLTQGSFQIRVQEVDLMRQVVDPAWRMLTMQPALRERLGTLALTRRLGEDLPPTIRTDATRAMQILVNVAHVFASHAAALPASAVRAASLHSGLNNAAKFTERGSIAFEVDRVSEPTDGIRFRVTDTGRGIAPEKQEVVFDLFTQEDSDSSRVFQGTGIGLSIGRRLASALGGTLQLYSEGVGRGCQFTLFLPLEPPAPRGEPPMAAVGARGEHHRVFGGESFVAGGSGRMHNGGRGPTVLLPFPEAQQHTTPAQSPPPVEGASARGGGSLAASLSASESSALPAVMADLSCSTSAASAIPATPPSPRRELAETASAAASSTQTAAAEEGASGGPAPEEQQPRPRRRILVAENDRLNQILVKKLLEKFKFEVVMTANGALAVDAFEQGRFEAVLLDINMPVLDGHGAARAMMDLIRSGMCPPTPIIALSASCSEEELRRCVASGFVLHIPKPLRLESFTVIEPLIETAAANR